MKTIATSFVIGVLLTLPDEVDALKFRLAHLFETWWRQQLEGWEDVIANTLIYLLKRSLSKGTVSVGDRTQGERGRLKSWENVITKINFPVEKGLS